MKSIDSWHRFATKHRNAPPLRYVSGLRHQVKQGVYCPMHSHSAVEIVFHPKGRGITRLRKGRSVAFDEGSVVVYAPGERHDQTLDCDGEDLCVMLAVSSCHRGVPSQGFHVERVEDAAVIEDIRLLSHGRVKLAPTEQAIFNFRATSTLFALLHLARAKEEERAHGVERYAQKSRAIYPGPFCHVGYAERSGRACRYRL